MKKIINNQFVYGTQYYRAPTPLPTEWEDDLQNMGDAGLDTIQLRVQWRWNELVEGKYRFDDLDRLFELSQKHHKQVIFKFLLENAPDYIFREYGGTRCDMHGVPLRAMANGAYYCGGWLPCFDNPNVVRKATEFTEIMVKRYRSVPNLLLWNIWNEPVTRPIGECGCLHSIEAYQEWLKEKFGTIEHLNDYYGKGWESFATVEPPGSWTDYAELYLWRQWALTAVSKRLEFMYKTVKALDPDRPVFTHGGAVSPLQDVCGGGSDDVQNTAHVDFYGSSFSTPMILDSPVSDSYAPLQLDWLRSISKYFWIHEMYPDWGAWMPRVKTADFLFRVLSILACGAKGLNYWQYRAERVGFENNLSGLVNIDGAFKEISYESAGIKKFISENEKFLLQAEVKSDPIAIVYSIKSDLINRVENTGKGYQGFWNFDLHDFEGNPLYLYKKALAGAYAMFRELGYTVDWIDSRSLPERAANYRIIYLPEYFIPTYAETAALINFSANGGMLIAEEGIGMRQENSWMYPGWPRKEFKELFGFNTDDRIAGSYRTDELTVGNSRVTSKSSYAAYIIPDDGNVIGHWQDGRPGAIRKGNAIYFGTSLGAVFNDYWNNEYGTGCLSILRDLLAETEIAQPESLPIGVYRRVLTANNREMHFIFNRSVQRASFLTGLNDATILYGNGKFKDGILTLDAQDICVIIETLSPQ